MAGPKNYIGVCVCVWLLLYASIRRLCTLLRAQRWIDGETKICILLRKVRTFLGSEDIWLVQRHIFVKLFKNENILLVWG